MKTIRFGLVGCGLMAREFASAAARWCHLTEDIARYALLLMPKVNTKQFTQSCSFMNLSELRSLRDGLRKQAGEIMPPVLQLRQQTNSVQNRNNNAFKI